MANIEEFVGLSTDESLLSNNSSLSGDRNNLNSVFLKFTELEKKIQEQGDEIVCLKSTLADVLRRLSQLDGRANVTSYHVSPSSQNNHIGNSKNVYNNRPNAIYHMKALGKNFSTLTNGTLNNTIRHHPTVNNRRYSSSTSLQSEFINSNNVSPISSPQPSANYRSMPMNSHNQTKSLMRMNSASNLKAMKRWSASQDIRMSSIESVKTSGSLYNLHALKNASNINRSRTGNFKDFQYNQVEGVIKFMLFDRSITINIPTEFLQTYTFSKNISNPPSQRLKLEWVYGYRGKDCRHNLFLLPTGEIVYFIASVVVLYNIDDQIQRHYTGHTSEVRCLTIHPNKLLIATGQNACVDSPIEKRPHVRIWDSVSLNTLHILGQNGAFDRGICCISFSKFDGGNHLCVVDDSNDHNVSVWEWHRGANGRISEAKSAVDAVLAVEFHPIEKNTLITIGRGHIYFWDFDGGCITSKKIGVFEKQDKPKYVLCMAFNDSGELLTGDSNGNINIWQPSSTRLIRTIYNAHDGGIFAICTLKDGTFVTGGGKDRKIVEWDSNMNRTGNEVELSEQYGGIRTLTTGKGSMIIVGTTRNCILQGTMALNFSLVIQGHIDDLLALAIHPTQNQFITAGHDKNIHLWDTMSHLVVWSKDIKESAHAATFSPDGTVIVVSTVSPSGKWLIFDATTKQQLSVHEDGSSLIECIKFSPNGRYLALSSRDNNIYIYQVSEEYRKFNRVGRCTGHHSYAISIDWDTSNTYIQTTTNLYEHVYWNATICRLLANVSISRDLEFVTHNSLIGFNVFGIWLDSFDAPLVNTADRSHNGKFLVSGDNVGHLNLYSYPACQPKCFHYSYPGHSSSVCCVRFLADDSRIISIGGKDSTILQWALI